MGLQQLLGACCCPSWLPVSTPIERRHWVRPQEGSLVEISATSATMLTQAPHRIEIGSWIELDVEGDCAVAAVQRIATTDPPANVYSVGFVMLAPTLRARIDHTIAAHLENRGPDRGATPLALAPSHPLQLHPTGHGQHPDTSDTPPFAFLSIVNASVVRQD